MDGRIKVGQSELMCVEHFGMIESKFVQHFTIRFV